LENIHFSIITDSLTAYRMYENNELDIMGIPFTGIPSDAVPSLLDKGLLQASALPASSICCFNMHKFPFNNLNIRKAFAFAINRKEIIDNITQMHEEVGLNLLPKILLTNQPPPFFEDGDVKLAQMYFRKGLKELGISRKDLKPIKLLHAQTGIYPKIAQALQQQWQNALGIEVHLQGKEYKIFLDKLNKKEFQISQCIWVTQYHDPMNILERFESKDHCKNYPGYENPEFSALLDQSHYTNSKEERLEIIRKAISIFLEEMPLTPIFHWNNMYMQKPYVKNLQLKPSGYLHLNNIYIQEDELESISNMYYSRLNSK
jgi:oligopeptide transport system substrate-binding protein